MGKTNVKVYVRTRPTAARTDGLKVGPESTITLRLPKDAAQGIVNNQQEDFSFKMDGILENVSQEAVYTSVAHEVVEGLMAGFNGTIFCYGQTGAGKTFTMSGDLHAFPHRGIIPRAVNHVFREIDMRTDKMFKVHVSYLEIYNEQLYDLLSDSPAFSDSLAVLEDANNQTYVRGLTRAPVSSEEEALAQFFVGEQGRATAGHVLNASSSRSHTLYTIHLEMRTSESASERAVLSKLHLVDLAGSERSKKTGVTGQTMKEAQFINRSLSFLEQTVNALARKDNYVPFRQTKLTSVLRDSLGGNCRTVMVANVWGEPSHAEETLSTLRFASRVRLITTELSLTESSDPALLLHKYERIIKDLKAELAMRDTLSGRGRISYEDLNDEELRELQAQCRAFLAGNTDVEALPSETLKRVRETYKMMRMVHQSMRSELAAQLDAQRRGTAQTEGLAGDMDLSSTGGVGDDATTPAQGFTVGMAPMLARPPVSSLQDSPGSHSPGDPSSPLGQHAASLAVPGGTAARQGANGSAFASFMGDRNAVFRRYKHEVSEGKALSNALRQAQEQLRSARAAVKQLGADVNAAKQQIDTLGAALMPPSQGPEGSGGDVMDSEAYSMQQQLRASKATYRHAFERLREAREGLEPCAAGVAEARAALVDAFERWADLQSDATLRRFAMAGGAMADDEEELDAGEQFDRMRIERIVATQPDSGPYLTALQRTKGHARSAGDFAGAKAAATATRKMEQVKQIAVGAPKR